MRPCPVVGSAGTDAVNVHVGVLTLGDCARLPVAGVVDVLRAANAELGENRYATVPLQLPAAARHAHTPTWPQALPDMPWASAPLAGVLVIASELPHPDDARIARLRELLLPLDETAWLGGLDLGAAWLAQAKLMQGHRFTVSAGHVGRVASQFSRHEVVGHYYCLDAKRMSCAGGTASIDMMIAWMQRQHDASFASALLARLGLERLRGEDELQATLPADPVAPAARPSPRLEEAMALMKANLSEPLSTQDIADLVGLSRRQLERLFKQHADTLPSRWYLEQRLACAQQMLRDSPHSILQVGLECGFSSAAHFSHAYRSHFGRTPRDERSSRAQAWRERATPSPGPLEETP